MKRLLLFFTLTGCVLGPTTEKKSPLNHLSGEHYSNDPVTAQPSRVMGVPLLKRKKQKNTIIRGQALKKSGLFNTPVKFAEIIILDKDGNTIARGSTDINGKYEVSSHFPNGSYKVLLKSKSQKGESSFEVKEYEVNNIDILLDQ